MDLTSTSSRICVCLNSFLHFSCFIEGAGRRIYDRRISCRSDPCFASSPSYCRFLQGLCELVLTFSDMFLSTTSIRGLNQCCVSVTTPACCLLPTDNVGDGGGVLARAERHYISRASFFVLARTQSSHFFLCTTVHRVCFKNMNLRCCTLPATCNAANSTSGLTGLFQVGCRPKQAFARARTNIIRK